MPTTIRVSHSVTMQQSPKSVFDAATNWSSQHYWIPFTKVTAHSGQAQNVGAEIHASTGIGPLKFLDSMVITAWQYPSICAVTHTGKVIKGSGTFKVEPVGNGSRFEWSEVSELPFGLLGILLVPFAWVISKVSLMVSLRLFVRNFHKLT